MKKTPPPPPRRARAGRARRLDALRNGSVSDDWAFAEEATVSDPDFLDATGALVPGSMIWLF